MAYTVDFKKRFAIEFARFPQDQQLAIADFILLYQQNGLHSSQWNKYPGKIAPSWKGLEVSHPNYAYARSNHLWHYHIGLPDYKQSPYGDYKTSDWLLHFQWANQGQHISLVDAYCHHTSDKTFYMPNPDRLIDKDPPTGTEG